MRRDRYGEPIEDDEPDTLYPAHRCTDGWLGEDDAGRPVPCLKCRPHLADRHHRPTMQPA